MTKHGQRTREDERKNELIKARIAELRKANPKLSFAQAWMKLQKEHPDWIKSDEAGFDPELEEDPGRGWHEQPPSNQRASASLVQCEASSDIFERGEAPNEIVYLPRGRQQITPLVSGVPKKITVDVDEEAALVLQEALKKRTRRAYGAFDHKPGLAAFHPKGFKWDAARGVVLEVEQTDAGKKAVAGKNYFGFSPTFLIAKDGERIEGLPHTGEIGSLTNNPAFPGLDRLAASLRVEELVCQLSGQPLSVSERMGLEWIMGRGYEPKYER